MAASSDPLKDEDNGDSSSLPDGGSKGEAGEGPP